MSIILLQALGFLLIIFMAYVLKSAGLFKTSDGHLLSKLIVNLTLPAAIIVGFNGIQVNSTFFLLILLGLCSNILLVTIGGFLARKQAPTERGLLMFSIAGYNIGNFTMPFVQGFFGAAVPILGMFDMGNALMLSGGTMAVTEGMTGKKEEKFSLIKIIKRLFASPPFSIYILMFLLAVFRLTLPESVLSIVHLFSSGNAFLSMFMIGLYLEIKIDKKDLSVVLKILATRYFFASIMACFFYFALPFPELVRKVLVLIAFAPIASLSTINSIVFGAKESIAGFLSSASILLSLLIMTGILILFM
ncbi:AEC family transporter [Carnobacterium gallinarum]|uniref:AEC family transporter n=1 Tax=Carnobacterium gallinarum TaxID=2749 RepID=UPI00055391AF|nr:AEC family transporter [Carnobacterium gallinarum]